MKIKRIISGIRPPSHGEPDFFKCLACGERFSAAISLLPIVTVQCPKCGSQNITHDMTIVH